MLLDSVILIDYFNNIPAATAYLRQTEGESAISVINVSILSTDVTTKTGINIPNMESCFYALSCIAILFDLRTELVVKDVSRQESGVRIQI